MFKTLASLMLAMVALVVMVGCETANGTADPRPVPLAEPVPILEKFAGAQCCVAQPLLRLVRDAQGLAALNCAHFEEWEIDFDQHDVIVATLGTQPTGGFAIDITAIQLVGDTLYVQGATTVPGEDDTVTQAITQPFCAVVVPKTGAYRLRSDIE